MATLVEKRAVIRLMREAIIQVCRARSLFGGRLEIDGIICIQGQQEGQELVIKLHELIGYEGSKYHEVNGRDFNSSFHSADEVQDLRKRRRLEDSAYDDGSPEYSEMSMDHDDDESARDLSIMSGGPIVITPDNGDSRSSPTPNLSPENRFVGTSMLSGGTLPYYFPKRALVKHERWSPNQPIPSIPECKQCNVVFDSFDILAEHNEAVHSVFTCQSCFKTFTSRSNLERHSRLHTGHKPYVCTICGKAFSRKDHLSNHATKHAYKCGTCSKRFSDKKMLVTHYQFDHNAVLTNICDYCNKGFSSAESYEEHLKVHPQYQGDKPESPRPMSASQTSPSVFRPSAKRSASPSSTPVNLAKSSCKKCSFSTSDPLTLAKHKLIHAETQRFFTCLACAKTFDDPLNYGDHMLVHQNEVNVFECVICRQLCSTLQSLRRHEANHLSDLGDLDLEDYPEAPAASSTPRYSCFTCNKSFATQSLLKDHMEMHLDLNFPERPVTVHGFACPTCKSDFDSYTALLFHMEKERHLPASALGESHQEGRNKRKQTYPKPLQLKTQPAEPRPVELDEVDMEEDYEIVEPESPEDSPPPLEIDEKKTDENCNSYATRGGLVMCESPVPEEAKDLTTKEDVNEPIKMEPVRSLLFGRQKAPEERERASSPAETSSVSARSSPVDGSTTSVGPAPSAAANAGGGASTTVTPSKLSHVDIPPGPYSCSHCQNVCSNFQELEMHCFSDHNRSPCMFCSKTFAQKANRDRHVCLHTGEKPYACPECDEKFSRGDKLKLHRTRVHKVQFPAYNVKRDTAVSPSQPANDSRDQFDNGDKGVSLWGKDGAGDDSWPVSLSGKSSDLTAYSGGHWTVNSKAGTSENVYQGGEVSAVKAGASEDNKA